MNKTNFLKELCKLKGKFELNYSGRIRTKKDHSWDGWIWYLCPIEEMYRKKCHKKAIPYDAAAEKLKLSPALTNTIIRASDLKSKDVVLYTDKTDIIKLRKQMKKALGL